MEVSNTMGIKRRIISSGRKFHTKHEDFYKTYQDRKEGEAGGNDGFVFVDTLSITDIEDGNLTLNLQVEGDLEAADEIKVYIDGVAQDQATMNALYTAPTGGTGGEAIEITPLPHGGSDGDSVAIKVSILRAGSAEVAKSEKSASVTVSVP